MMLELPIIKRQRDKCPNCGSEIIKQYRTERFSATYIIRYYLCQKCKSRFKTES